MVERNYTPTRLLPGDQAPYFVVRSSNNDHFKFSIAAGRYVVLCFFGSAKLPDIETALKMLLSQRDLFDDDKVTFFGVSIDPDDEREGRFRQSLPGIRAFWDFDQRVSRLYGAVPEVEHSGEENRVAYRPFVLVLDPSLRVMKNLPFACDYIAELISYTRALPDVNQHAGVNVHAPVLIIPRIFEPEFCQQLISLYEEHGGVESGFMRDINGKTVRLVDYGHKRRSDYNIEGKRIREMTMQKIRQRLVPEIYRCFQYKVTRMERYIVACYDADSGGYFRPHRDNTTKGTAHRRFAVTINLNAEDYQGGNLRFPEFGSHSYRPPTGGALVFSCSLLHEATPVLSGRRFAFLPFLYDDEAAIIRQQNNQFLDEGVGNYQSDLSSIEENRKNKNTSEVTTS